MQMGIICIEFFLYSCYDRGNLKNYVIFLLMLKGY